MRTLLLLTFLCSAFSSLHATHIVGGEISYECLGFDPSTQTGTYRIILKVYRDCFNGVPPLDNPAPVTIFPMDNVNNPFVIDLYPVVTNIPVVTNNPCLIPPDNICVQEGYYEEVIQLPYNASGYTFAYQRCCRNNTITNINQPNNTGATYDIFMSGFAQTSCNSSPIYNDFPPLVICNQQPFDFDHSATDAQGDQLVYSLCTPRNGGNPNNPLPDPANPPPYQAVTFVNPYNAANPMGGAPPITINAQTGLITGFPTTLGQYVVAICVQEYRNGVLLSETRRDFQFNVTDCTLAVEPTPHADTSTMVFVNGLQLLQALSCDLTVQLTFSTPPGIPIGLLQGQRWNISGNGFNYTSTNASITVTFPAPGLYNGRIITNPGLVDCTDSTDFLIRVYPPRTADFGLAIDSCNALAPIVFTDSSQAFGPGNVITNYNWNFGPGMGTSNLQNPTWLPPSAGSFAITLRVTDSNLCTATYSVNTDWYPANASFTLNAPSGCEPFTSIITNTSTPYLPSYTTAWDFADGSTFTGQNPQPHLYTQPGVYNIVATVTSPWGCTDQDSHILTVFESPTANFSLNYDTCSLGPVVFTDLSVPGGAAISSWTWNFGDGQTSILQNPVHQYDSTQAGNYVIQLTIVDANGCTSTFQRSLAWFPEPVLAIGFAGNIGCAPYPVTFVNNSYPINGYTTLWNFGDGGTSTQPSPTHVYNAGFFPVTLYVTSPNGICADTFTTNLTVYGRPNAAFNYTFDTCAIAPVSFFENATTNAAGTPLTTWEWNLGDGTDTLAQDLVYQYTNSGAYNVNFVVTDANGCTDTATQTVPWFPEPVVAVNVQGTDGCFGDTVFFQNNSYPINGYTTLWNFGDGNTSNLASPNHVYAAPGTYFVSLQITSPTGWCQATFLDTVVVNPAPTADFTFFVDGCNFTPVIFTDQSSPGPNNNPLTSWVWDFGDGTDTTTLSPAPFGHLPPLAGSFQVTLTVYDSRGCWDNQVQTVNWFPEPVVDVNIANLSACLGESVFFQNNSYPINGYTTVWNFGDGSTSNQASPTHTYAAPGFYPVTLTISSPNGVCVETFSDTVVVNSLPVANFSYGGNGCVLGPVPFGDATTIATNPITNPIVAWDWQLGDGTDTTLASFEHLYPNPGTYTVSLVVTDAAGCTDSVAQSFVWYPSFPFEIIVDDDHGCAPHTTSFDLNSFGNDISQYIKTWYFGDGDSLVANPPVTHTYLGGGDFVVTVTLTAPLTNCTQAATDTVHVLYQPVPQFAISFDSCATTGSVQINDLSTSTNGQLLTWSWDFGGGVTSNLQNPATVYDTIGTYPVTLIVIDSAGCTDTLNSVVAYEPRPIWPVLLEDLEGCTPFLMVLPDNIYPLPDYTTTWDFGDGSTSTDATPPPHLYDVTGIYPVQLVVASTTGCVDTFGLNAESLPLPVAAFNYNPQNPSNFNPDVTFTDLSIDASAWLWDFGTGETSTFPSPVYSYPDTGVFNILLTVTHDNGCTDTATARIDVAPRFTYFLPNAVSPDGDGINDLFRGEGITDKIVRFNMSIWNRWGELIFETNDPTEAWNGRKHNNGEDCQPGVYTVLVELEGGRGVSQQEKGFVVLVR